MLFRSRKTESTNLTFLMRGVREAGSNERRHNPRYVHFGIEYVERRGERERLTSLLVAVGETVRVVCAPADCGKTAAARH